MPVFDSHMMAALAHPSIQQGLSNPRVLLGESV